MNKPASMTSQPKSVTAAHNQALVRLVGALDPDRKVFVYPVAATWAPDQREVRWIGAPQVQASFAHRLVAGWRVWATDEGHKNPCIFWHRTEGDGHCLARLNWHNGAWHASAVMLSHRDAMALDVNPFLLMYGYDMPQPQHDEMEVAHLSIGKLCALSLERLTHTCSPELLAEAEGVARGWWEQAQGSQKAPRLVASSNSLLMTAAWSAWSRLKRHERAKLSLALAPQVMPERHSFGPTLICLRADSPLLTAPHSDARVSPASAPPRVRDASLWVGGAVVEPKRAGEPSPPRGHSSAPRTRPETRTQPFPVVSKAPRERADVGPSPVSSPTGAYSQDASAHASPNSVGQDHQRGGFEGSVVEETLGDTTEFVKPSGASSRVSGLGASLPLRPGAFSGASSGSSPQGSAADAVPLSSTSVNGQRLAQVSSSSINAQRFTRGALGDLSVESAASGVGVEETPGSASSVEALPPLSQSGDVFLTSSLPGTMSLGEGEARRETPDESALVASNRDREPIEQLWRRALRRPGAHVEALVQEAQQDLDVQTIDDYNHALNLMVVTLEPHLEPQNAKAAADVFWAMTPDVFGLGGDERARVAFNDAVVDLLSIGRVGRAQEETMAWVEALTEHPKSMELLSLGVGDALAPVVVRLSVNGEKPRALVRLGMERSLRRRGRSVALGRVQRAWLDAIAPVDGVSLSSRRARRATLDAAQRIMAMAAPKEPEPNPLDILREIRARVENKLMRLWGLSTQKRPCFVWAGMGEGSGWSELVSLTRHHHDPEERDSAVFPVVVEPGGPEGSRKLLFEAAFGVHQRRPVVPDEASEDVMLDMAGPSVICSPMRNLWARVGRGSRGGGVGSGAGATIVSPTEPAHRWPRLVRNADGVIWTLDLAALARGSRSQRQRVEAWLAGWAEARGRSRSLPCNVLLTGYGDLFGGAHDAAAAALRKAERRLLQEREMGVRLDFLDEAASLGDLALEAVEGSWVRQALKQAGWSPTFFVAPEAQGEAGHMVDLALIHLMHQCRVQLNLVRHARTPSAEQVIKRAWI